MALENLVFSQQLEKEEEKEIIINNNRKTIWICIEGIDGIGKTTLCQNLSDMLKKTNRVFSTSEPGSPHVLLSRELRTLMLDAQFEKEMTKEAREYISQAARSVHLRYIKEKVLGQYDFIIQDRGVLSGLCYGQACGNNIDWLFQLARKTCDPIGDFSKLYNIIIVLKANNNAKCLARAKSSKKEFAKGDIIESKGLEFFKKIDQSFLEISQMNIFKKIVIVEIDIENDTKEKVLMKVIKLLKDVI